MLPFIRHGYEHGYGTWDGKVAWWLHPIYPTIWSGYNSGIDVCLHDLASSNNNIESTGTFALAWPCKLYADIHNNC